MTRRPLFFVVLLVVVSLTLAACLPVAEQPAPSSTSGGSPGGGGGGLPSAPGGAAPGEVQSDTNANPAVGAESWQVVDAPDPFVLRVDPGYCAPDNGGVAPAACYYAYTTMVLYNPIPVWRSSDLVYWHMAGGDGSDADTYPDGTAVDPNTFSSWSHYFERWAPSVMQIGGQYVMWYAARSKSSAKHCLGVAVASSPDGPFVDATSPYCRNGENGVIDPSPYVDGSGRRYLTYKTEVYGGIIYAAELSGDGRSLLREGTLLTNAGGWELPRIEGPTLVRGSPGLFLFYSAGAWETSSYVVAAARCDGPLGPCSRVYSTPMLANRGSARGPGGQTPFVDAGGALRIAFHAWSSSHVGYPSGARSLRFLPVTWPGGKPKVG